MVSTNQELFLELVRLGVDADYPMPNLDFFHADWRVIEAIAEEQGFKTFYLGGGVGSGEDNLYKFKAAFNKVSDYQFSIGKQIFNQEVYDRLVEMRRESDSSSNDQPSYFPLYRAM